MRSPRATACRKPSAVAAGALAMVLACGCAQAPKSPDRPSAPRAGAADRQEPAPRPEFQRLRDLSLAQERHPVRSVMGAPAPPGLDAALVEPPPASMRSPDATTPTQTLIARLAAGRPTPPTRPAVSAPDADAALHLYVSGRDKLFRREVPAAVADLKKVTELDPGAGEPWRELGEAQLAAGWRTDAQASFEKALDCGLEDPRVLQLLGRGAAEKGDQALAASLLARASLAAPEKSDPLLPAVIEVALAKALAAQGFTAAAREELIRAVGRSPQLSASTRYGEEFGAIFRRQGELWREIGDYSCRLGEYERAIDAYERASELPTLDGKSLAPRVVFAALRSGRPAAAALSVLEDIADQNGRVSDEQARFLASIGATGSTGPEISRALEQFPRTLPGPVAPSVAGGLARARAAVLPAPDAARVLREYLAVAPGDGRAITALLETATDARAAAALGAEFVSQHPDTASRTAQSLLRTRFDADALQTALTGGLPSEDRTILAARVLQARGFDSQAAALARGTPAAGKLGAEAALCKVETGISAGDSGASAAGLLAARQLPGNAPTKARALAWFQLNREALACLEPALAGPARDAGARIEDLLLASDLATSLSRADDAERWLRDAAALDVYDERAPSRLLALYGPGGAKADSGKLGHVIRTLRQTIPESRTLRGARVKELQRRALLDQAQDDARRLCEEEPSDASAIELLVSTWHAQSAREGPEVLARGREWLESQLVRRPGSAPILSGLANLLAASSESAAAESRLKAALAAGAGPDVSRVLEKVLRDDLKRPQEADALLLARLEGRGRLPGESIELADCYTRNKDESKAARVILDAFPDDVAMLPDQSARVLMLIGAITQSALTKDDPDRRGLAVELFDLAAGRGLNFTPDLHDRRLQLLALWPQADAARILDAATLTATQYPNLGSAPFVRASSALAQANRGATALVLISTAVDHTKEPSLDLFVEWARIVATFGTPAHARVLIERADAAGKLKDLVERFEGPPPADAPARNLRAECAYMMGNLFAAGKRTDQSDAAYELALTYDPNHPWACNNLGYSLLERGTDLARASNLLERAHEALPDEGSITDSLGWLRYKQAVIADERDASGAVTRRGAVSLLQAASMTDRGRDDPTILNHLADALWLDGRTAEARRYWELCEQLTTRLLSPRPDPKTGRQLDPTPAAADEYRAIKESVVAKRRAAAAGDHVRVAPQLGNPDPAPAPQAQAPNAAPAPAKVDDPADGGGKN